MTIFDPATTRKSLFRALLDAADLHGRGKLILEDPERSPLSYGRLILASFVIGRRLAAETRHGEAVGVLLPNVNAVAIVILGLSAFGRVAAMLNFTAGLANLRSAARTVEIETVVTSPPFRGKRQARRGRCRSCGRRGGRPPPAHPLSRGRAGRDHLL